MKKIVSFLTRLFKSLSKQNFDSLFYIAAFTLPFENLFFAPSKGWATITPLILFLYAILNLYHLKPFLAKIRPILLFFICFGLLGTITTAVYHGRIDDYFSACIPPILGLSCLFSLLEFYTKNQKSHLKQKLNLLASIIILSYLITLIIGLIEYLTIKYQLDDLSHFFNFLFKRNYLAKNRVQFFFTEPSFIGMHLFGIMLPLFWLTRRKDLLFLIILYIYSAIFFGAGVRIIIDTLIISVILSFYYLKKTKLKLFIPLFITTLVIFITSVSTQNGRFHKIFFGFIDKSTTTTLDCNLAINQNSEECLSLFRKSGINSDGSFASRIFRVKSSLFGYLEAPIGATFGYGLGNSIYPARLGHQKAKQDYKSSYMKEVNDLENQNYHDDSVSYCLYTRIISEFGIFALFLILFYLYKLAKNSSFEYKFHYLLIVLYLYLQFESLSFYAIWFYIATMFIFKKISNPQIEKQERIND